MTNMAASNLTKTLALRGAYGAEMPRLMYGTAWKKEQTADLVYQAIKAGFRGIDTAAQPKHYREDLVGEGIRRAVSEGIVSRKDLYIQTKFTSPSGQNPNSMPYDSALPIPSQVHASVSSSLVNLATPDVEPTYLDSVVLHSPYDNDADTLAAWRALRTYVPHVIRHIGISNVTLDVVRELDKADSNYDTLGCVSVVQNRFHAETGYDVALRAFCREKKLRGGEINDAGGAGGDGIVYQAFWTLTANPALVRSEPVTTLVRETKGKVDAAGALYCLLLGLEGTVVLDGTTSEKHMREDLEAVQTVATWGESEEGRAAWEKCLGGFKELIREGRE
jgi:diketogulonate reductase-like aldo/keto reductase